MHEGGSARCEACAYELDDKVAWHTLCPAICGGDGRGSKPAVAGEDQLSDPWAADETIVSRGWCCIFRSVCWYQVVGVVLCLMLWRVLPPQPEQDFYLSAGNLVKMQASTLPLGFWVDGVPVKWDRSESIILFTLNFPGQLHADFKTLRIPLTMINKKNCRGNTERFTWDHFLAWRLGLGGALPAYMLVFSQQVQCLDKSHSILGDRSKLVSLWMQVVCS